MPSVVVDADVPHCTRVPGCTNDDFGAAIGWVEHEADRDQRPE
jgi:hypothetical protein